MKLSNLLPVSVLKTGGNEYLPGLPASQAASSWAVVLMALATIANTLGVDLFGFLSGLGLGDSPEEVIDAGGRTIGAVQQLLPLVFGVWAWIERLAPRFRLTFRGGNAL